MRDGILKHKDRLCVTDDEMLKRELIEETHHSLYIVHPGSTKMYRDLRDFSGRAT